jgi:hypothetical protein
MALVDMYSTRHLGSERGPVGKQRDLRRANPFVGWYFLFQVSFSYTSCWLWLNILMIDTGKVLTTPLIYLYSLIVHSTVLEVAQNTSIIQ